jgi:signal transduction histidine kinase
MNWLIGGLIFAWAVSLAVTAAVAVYGHRRAVRLRQRIAHAERLAELGLLTGGLAHELKNPLSTVQLNLQLLREDLDPTNPAIGRLVHRLGTVQREVGRLKDILDDFLRYAGKLELERRPTDLNAMLEELVDFFLPQAQLQRVQLHVRPAEGAVVASVDARLLKQAVLNLMLNGVQAMSEGGGELILSAGRRGGEAVIEVIDTGRGISEEDLPRIFQAYYSTQRGGTGLGLAMAQRIVQEHGGRIDVRSEVGKGSDFSIILPAG